jgi:hypothetical protein
MYGLLLTNIVQDVTIFLNLVKNNTMIMKKLYLPLSLFASLPVARTMTASQLITTQIQWLLNSGKLQQVIHQEHL